MFRALLSLTLVSVVALTYPQASAQPPKSSGDAALEAPKLRSDNPAPAVANAQKDAPPQAKAAAIKPAARPDPAAPARPPRLRAEEPPREVMIVRRRGMPKAELAPGGAIAASAADMRVKPTLDVVRARLRNIPSAAIVDANATATPDVAAGLPQTVHMAMAADGTAAPEIRVSVAPDEADQAAADVNADGQFDVTFNRLFWVDQPTPAPAGTSAAALTLFSEATGTVQPTRNIAATNGPLYWAKGFTGRGVKVGVVDTGVNNHVALANRIENGATFLNRGARVARGVEGQRDLQGHGTHVAGLVAGGADTDGGVRTDIGMAPEASIIPMCVLEPKGNTAVGYDNDIIAACHEAINRGAKVINMSLGTSNRQSEFAQEWDQLLQRAESEGVMIVAATGNHQEKFPGVVGPPASLAAVISVGAVDDQNQRAPYSVFNPAFGLPKIAAPGGLGVVGRQIPSASHLRSPGLALLQGTSQATPHVSGAAALLLSERPSMALSAWKAKLLSSVAPNSASGQFGAGILLLGEPGSSADPGTTNPGGDPVILKRLKARIEFWQKQGIPPSEPVND